MLTQTEEKHYICPGETHPISRSVHLSRLAAFYPACRDCPFRNETGQIPAKTIERLQETERRVERKSLLTADGVRGVYLNELNRKKAEQYAAAFASLLWEQSPYTGKRPSLRSGSVSQKSAPKRHSIVLGYDERPSSPEIVTGVASSLRRMGCHVIDIGLSTTPCFRFAVDHLQATAGIFVTGSGCDPSWTGLDFVGKQAVPLSAECGVRNAEQNESNDELTLDRIEARLKKPISRPTRSAGSQHTFQAFVPYEAGLWKHFSSPKPLRVACGCSSRLARRTLETLFATIPCELEEVEIPQRARNIADAEDPDVIRVGDVVYSGNADLGVLIGDDSQQCGFLDENGELISSERITRTLLEFMLPAHPGETIVIENSADEVLAPSINEAGGICIDGVKNQQEMCLLMRDHKALFGGGDSGRYWFRESFPTCDAFLSLAMVLELLSRNDAPFSELTGIIHHRDTESRRYSEQ